MHISSLVSMVWNGCLRFCLCFDVFPPKPRTLLNAESTSVSLSPVTLTPFLSPLGLIRSDFFGSSSWQRFDAAPRNNRGTYRARVTSTISNPANVPPELAYFLTNIAVPNAVSSTPVRYASTSGRGTHGAVSSVPGTPGEYSG